MDVTQDAGISIIINDLKKLRAVLTIETDKFLWAFANEDVKNVSLTLVSQKTVMQEKYM